MFRVAVGVGALLTFAGCAVTDTPISLPSFTSTPTPTTATGQTIAALLDQVQVVDRRPNPDGYDRDCSSGSSCVFGLAWTDNNTGPSGHDGCSERDHVLRTQLSNVVFKAGSNCVVVSGVLDPEPYTGKPMMFSKARANDIHVDHIYPLAAAWDFGANTWTAEQRTAFANDTSLELLAVEGGANMAKGDKTLSAWLPANEAYRCTYMHKYLTVAVHYKLAISAADARQVREQNAHC